MIKTLSMVSHKNYNLNTNEDFVIFWTSKLITCIVDGFNSKMKSQSIAYLLDASEHVYRILDLEDKVHSRWVTYTSNLQKCESNFFSRSWAGEHALHPDTEEGPGIEFRR
jgi:hypothetical protein